MIEGAFGEFGQTESPVDYESGSGVEASKENEREEMAAILKDLEEKLHEGKPKNTEKDDDPYIDANIENLRGAIPDELSRNGIEVEEGGALLNSDEERVSRETIDYATEELERSLMSEKESRKPSE